MSSMATAFVQPLPVSRERLDATIFRGTRLSLVRRRSTPRSMNHLTQIELFEESGFEIRSGLPSAVSGPRFGRHSMH